MIDKFENYKAEVKERWGNTDAYKEHAEKSKNYSKDKWNSLVTDMDGIFAEFAAAMKNDVTPESEDVHNLVKKLQSHISDNYYNCTKEILSGLGQMYAAGGEFTENIDKAAGDGTAVFARDAIEVFVK